MRGGWQKPLVFFWGGRRSAEYFVLSVFSGVEGSAEDLEKIFSYFSAAGRSAEDLGNSWPLWGVGRRFWNFLNSFSGLEGSAEDLGNYRPFGGVG